MDGKADCAERGALKRIARRLFVATSAEQLFI
jgi:hypothetical protein